MNPSFADWLLTRPESVQRLAREFPIGTSAVVGGRTLYLLGYLEDDRLIVSAVNPVVDYDGANAAKEYLCAEHLRKIRDRTLREIHAASDPSRKPSVIDPEWEYTP